MTSIDDLTTSFKALMYERLNSTFGASLVISWIVFNWEGLYFVFNDEGTSLLLQIEHIKLNYINFDNNFKDPLLYAFGISILYPLISFTPFWCQELLTKWKRKAKESFIRDKLLTHEESVKLSSKIAEVTKLNEQI